MAGIVHRRVAEALIVALVVFALLVEILLHKLEHWIHERHPQLQSMLRNLYRELMILGIVSFGFIMFVFIADPDGDTKMTFEVAHIFIFLFACFHTATVGIAVFISLRLSRRWQALERMDLVKYLDTKEKYRKLTDKRTAHKNPLWRHFAWWVVRPSRLLQYRKLHEIMAFHDIRWQFIYYRNLQPDFRFSKFLRKIKFATFIELVEIHPVNWIVLLVLVVLDIVRVTIGSHRNFEPLFFIAHSVFNIALVSILAYKIRRVYWQMTKNPATYYDTIDPVAFREELAIAEEEARIRREANGEPVQKTRRRSSRRNSDARAMRPSVDRAGGSHDKHHEPVYANMAYVPGKHGHGHGHAEGDDRFSLDLKKVRGDRERPALVQVDSTVKPARYAPTSSNEKPGTSGVVDTLLERAKEKMERNDADRMSLDVAAAMPKKELDMRAEPAASFDLDYLAESPGKLQHMSTARRKLRMEALRRLRERKQRNAAIVETAQDLQAAQSTQPRRKYPGWLVKLFPRLGRVPSAAEKLFWFGSHRFYLFCTEFVLFFTNVNLSASIAKLAFWYKDQAYIKYKAGKSVKMILTEFTMRAPAKTTSSKASGAKKETESVLLLWIALAMALVACFYVLTRISVIMKKYIFVLNNSNLLPEHLTSETIQKVHLKDALNAETMPDGEGGPLMNYVESDTETEDDFSQMRRNVSQFIQKEQSEVTTPKSPLVPAGEDDLAYRRDSRF